MYKTISAILAVVVFLLLASPPAHAQWQTQSLTIKPGWTAVYMHVDASYANLDSLVGGDSANPIDQVWLWAPAGTVQFTSSQLTPLTGSSQWAVWQRVPTNNPNTLVSLVPNAAFLVHSKSSATYTWKVRGRPATPNYVWAANGLNLLGFPTVATNAPKLDNFFSLAPDFQNNVSDIYQYIGGDLGPSNPLMVFAPHTVTTTRGQAFWLRSGTYFNNYFGPFKVGISGGLDFSNTINTLAFHLKNTTPFPVTVTAKLFASEVPPAGQTAIAGLPPLVVRGPLNTNLTYTVSNLTTTSPLSWTLAPNTNKNGSDIVVVIGVNRANFTGNSGSLYAGILSFTDSYNYTEVDVPVSASPNNYAGLWVGAAVVSQVANYLKIYQRDSTNGLVLNPDGSYAVTGVNTALSNTPSPFPQRLILHNDGSHVTLLQHVFFGSDPYSNNILSTSQSRLDPTKLGAARRLTAVQFPWSSTNRFWQTASPLVPGGNVSFTVDTAYDDYANNPFLHTYHPDHDNLDASFKTEAVIGSESYGITRQITLAPTVTGTDFDSLTQAGQSLRGAYGETIIMTGINHYQRTNYVAGSFTINRISSIATLTLP